MKPVGVLLRAVNLAGRRLPMADFRAALANAGLPDAVTLGATGNAVVRAKAADAELESRIEAGLKAAFGESPDVFVRDAEQLAAIIAGNPFPDMAESAPDHLLVMFLRAEPDPSAVEALQAKISGPEQVAAGSGCLYARYPVGIGRSKLTSALIERSLKLRGTGRNWNTTRKLSALVAAA